MSKDIAFTEFFKNIRNVKSNEFASLRGFDVSDEAVEVALKIRSSQSEFGQIQIAKRDLFDPSNQHGLENAQNWVIANVPYGVRLDAFDVQKAYEVLRSHWRPQRMLLVMSHEQGEKLRVKESTDVKIDWVHLNNQGIHCRALIVSDVR